jgi:Uma2 family endonuclease
MRPTPRTATEADWERLPDELQKTCELVDGTLVRKPMGVPESILATAMSRILGNFVSPSRLAVILGSDGPMRFLPGQLRMPDVSLFLREHLPDGKASTTQVTDLVPDLAVEVLGPGNTRNEIEKKLELYQSTGVSLVWIVEPKKRTVKVHRLEESPLMLKEGDELTGEPVLPGFRLSLAELFRELE